MKALTFFPCCKIIANLCLLVEQFDSFIQYIEQRLIEIFSQENFRLDIVIENEGQ